MIYLYTENFFFLPRLKKAIKNFLSRDFGGPQQAVHSLMLGLQELKQPYLLNKRAKFVPVACVLTGGPVLKWALKQKAKGAIGKIIAGPDVGMPQGGKGIIYNPQIDRFLVPALWVKDFCQSFNPAVGPRIRVWAAGTDSVPKEILAGPRQGLLVYQKNAPAEVLAEVIRVLKQRQMQFTIIQYGKYRRDEFLRLLLKAKGIVFLSVSESQGLALNEAWARNVPTLAYNGSYLNTPELKWPASSPAPYLNSQSGIFFNSAAEFANKLEEFLAKLSVFQPELYHQQNFTNRCCAENYLKIINELQS